MDPVTGSALIGAGASLLGNIFGSNSNKSINQTNLKIAQMNNEFNERMLQKQMDYNTQMWNAQNEYNTPANQVQRLKDAGLNPSLMMGQGQTGTASAAGGVTPPTAQGVTMHPYQPDFSGIGQAAQTYVAMQLEKSKVQSQNALTDAQTQQMYIENQYRAQKLLAEIAQKSANTRNVQAKTAYQTIENSMRKQMLGAEYALTQKQIQSVEQQTKLQMVNTLLMSKELATYDERTRVAIANQSADTLVKLAQKQLSVEQAKREIAETLISSAKLVGQKISNTIAERSADYIVEKSRLDSYHQSPIGLMDEAIGRITGKDWRK